MSKEHNWFDAEGYPMTPCGLSFEAATAMRGMNEHEKRMFDKGRIVELERRIKELEENQK